MTAMYLQVFDRARNALLYGQQDFVRITPNSVSTTPLAYEPLPSVVENPPGTFAVVPPQLFVDAPNGQVTSGEFAVGPVTVSAPGYVPERVVYRDGGPYSVYLRAFPGLADTPDDSSSVEARLRAIEQQLSDIAALQTELLATSQSAAERLLSLPEWVTFGNRAVNLSAVTAVEWTSEDNAAVYLKLTLNTGEVIRLIDTGIIRSSIAGRSFLCMMDPRPDSY